MKERKNVHLTLEDRIEIQDCLCHEMTFKAIGRHLGKDQTTISKEVKRNIVLNPTTTLKKDKNGLVVSSICPKLLKAPFVCNGCRRKSISCSFDKSMYYAKLAQKKYEEQLHSSREGIPLNKESFYEIDRILSSGIEKGQHLYHIMATQDLGVSKTTIYRHLQKGYYSVCAIDFPRVVKFKARKGARAIYIPKALKIGRTYIDYLAYIEENPEKTVVEMDTLIGRIGGKAILTLHFPKSNFMLGILLENKDTSNVSKAILALKEKLKAFGLSFGEIFCVLLTDNGSEFADIFSIENDLDGERETRLFFCDPNQPNQKPHIEKNHTLFRDIVPKGESFDELTQGKINLIFSHMNSIRRKEFNGKSAYDMFTFMYDETLATILEIQRIEDTDVVQSPKLLRVNRG
jgi:IS30 family transposase